MKKFYEKMAAIMDVENVKPADLLHAFDAWDSLAAISILAMAQTDYKVTISKEDMDNFQTVKDLEKFIMDRVNDK